MRLAGAVTSADPMGPPLAPSTRTMTALVPPFSKNCLTAKPRVRSGARLPNWLWNSSNDAIFTGAFTGPDAAAPTKAVTDVLTPTIGCAVDGTSSTNTSGATTSSIIGASSHPRLRLLVIAQVDVLSGIGRRAALELRTQLEHVAHAIHVERAVYLKALERRIEGLGRDILRQLQPLGEQRHHLGLVGGVEHPAHPLDVGLRVFHQRVGVRRAPGAQHEGGRSLIGADRVGHDAQRFQAGLFGADRERRVHDRSRIGLVLGQRLEPLAGAADRFHLVVTLVEALLAQHLVKLE